MTTSKIGRLNSNTFRKSNKVVDCLTKAAESGLDQ